jgi:hypothetical protein
MSSLIPTAYLPPIGYMARLVHSGSVVIEVWESYTKQTCRNHCNIYSPNGLQTLTIPVIKVNGNHTLTKDIRIANQIPWQINHWRSIETAYNNSPFFLYYQDFLLPFYQKKYDFLLDLNADLLKTIIKLLKLDIPVERSVAFCPDRDINGREMLVSKKSRFTNPLYHQVFTEKSGFIPNLSIVDLLFNLGNESLFYLSNLDKF